MEVYKKIDELQKAVKLVKLKNKKVGFVPTMGALHDGHISLINQSTIENDITVCSIFVNPIQFNNQADYQNYPITFENDLFLLNQTNCDFLFLPTEAEIYPEQVTKKYSFGPLEQVLEGLHRPGHFNGVAVVVNRLFDIVKPDRAYFGEKDFQQLLIVKELIKIEKLAIEIIPCPIYREKDGLAMSSRNLRLTKEERAVAPLIYKTLQQLTKMKSNKSIQYIKEFVVSEFKKEKLFTLEHFEIVNQKTLATMSDWSESDFPHAFIAAFLGNVRLIDNQKLF